MSRNSRGTNHTVYLYYSPALACGVCYRLSTGLSESYPSDSLISSISCVTLKMARNTRVITLITPNTSVEFGQSRYVSFLAWKGQRLVRWMVLRTYRIHDQKTGQVV